MIYNNQSTPDKNYREITYLGNRARLKILKELQYQSIKYFENTNFNLLSGESSENTEARDARAVITRLLMDAYAIIRLAGINPSAQSTATLAVKGSGRNIDLIMNIFNLHKNDIPPAAAMEYIERAIDTYQSNRLSSLLRTMNPFFWLDLLVQSISRRSKHHDAAGSTLPSSSASRHAPPGESNIGSSNTHPG